MSNSIRELMVNRPDDVEWFYECDCGYKEYVNGLGCDCDRCEELGDRYGRPMKTCPDCGSEFVTVKT